MKLTFKRINLKVHSLAGLEGGGVSIAGDGVIDGTEQPITIVVDSAGWQRIASNVAWFAKDEQGRPTAATRPADESRFWPTIACWYNGLPKSAAKSVATHLEELVRDLDEANLLLPRTETARDLNDKHGTGEME